MMKCVLFLNLVFFVLFSSAQDSILLLSNESDALAYKLQLIQEAKQSVFFSYYAINEDEVGLKFAALACLKAREGVRVKIIIERSRSKITEQLVKIFKENGVEIKYYNSFRVRKTYKNFSWLHDKLLVVDSFYVVLGGRNLNNKYYPNQQAPTELVDVETVIKGSAGATAQRYFHHLFNSKYASSVRKKNSDTLHYNKLLQQIEKNIVEFNLKTDTSLNMNYTMVSNAVFVHDDYSKWPKSKTIANSILLKLKSAKKSIEIASPYLIPPFRFMKVLKKAAHRNVEIILLTNSAQISDAKIIAAAYKNDFRKYLKNNIKVFEYNGEKMLHDKLFLIDDSIAIVGSYNFDNISYRMNSEVIAIVEYVRFAQQIHIHIQSRLQQSIQITKRNQKNPYDSNSIRKRTKWNRILLYVVPFIRRFL